MDLLIRNRIILNKEIANMLAHKYSLTPSAIWMTYLRSRAKQSKYLPLKDPLGRKRLGAIVQKRATLRRILLRKEGDARIRLPSRKLATRWGTSQPTVNKETTRMLAQLKREGHKMGVISRGRPVEKKSTGPEKKRHKRKLKLIKYI